MSIEYRRDPRFPPDTPPGVFLHRKFIGLIAAVPGTATGMRYGFQPVTRQRLPPEVPRLIADGLERRTQQAEAGVADGCQ